MASVSRKSTLRRRSLLHTRHARLAMGMAFHSISGMLTATTNGFALNAIKSDSVGRPSGDSEENKPGTSPLVGAADFGTGFDGTACGDTPASGLTPAEAATNVASSREETPLR